MVARRRILLAFACSAAAVTALTTTAPAAPSRSTRAVFYDGDSLAVGTSLYLNGFLRGWSVRKALSISRHAYEGVADVRARGAALERVVVLDLGTNDDPSMVSRFTSYVRQVVRLAGPTRCVIWSTINRPPFNGVSWDRYNAALIRLTERYRNLHVFDWASMARANPGWFGGDGVHPNGTGYRLRAAALARLIKQCQ